MQLASAAGDKSLLLALRLLRAEIRAVLGDATGSGTDLTDALREYQEPSLEILAESHRVLGRALAREGDHTGSRVAFDRSQRILNAIGHIRAQREVAAQAAAEEARQPTAPSSPRDDAAALVSTSPGRPDLLMARLVAALQQASRPDLLGAELLDVLIDTGTTQRAALLVRDPTRGVSVFRHIGWTEDEALATAANPPSSPLALGSWRDATWQLVVDVPPSVSAQSAWLAVHTLAVSGLELARARRDAREREALWPIADPDEPSPGVFGSEQMSELLRITRRIATTHVTVLITGETGAGKEVLAHVLHDASSRAGKPFVPLNCSAVPRDMLEDQLFGHRRGAFTGAESAFQGVIRAAEGGTVFLDEIGEVGIDLQPKLLRFLESGEVHPLGEPHPIRVDVRVVAATNQDLEQLVRDGRFREDLYYRLNVIRLHVPPLRERREEIPLLVSHFLERFARESQKGRLRVAEETMEYLVLFAWPGNVRQLANELRRMVAFAEQDAILMPEHLSPAIVASRRTRPASERDLLPTELVVRIDQPLAAATEHLERALIQHALTICHGRLEEAAAMLGLSRKGLYLKRQRLGIGTPAA
jgi:DNA-binding NtrC family response regulator